MDESILGTVQRIRDRFGHETISFLLTNLRGTMFLIAPGPDLSVAGATIYMRNHPWDCVARVTTPESLQALVADLDGYWPQFLDFDELEFDNVV